MSLGFSSTFFADDTQILISNLDLSLGSPTVWPASLLECPYSVSSATYLKLETSFCLPQNFTSFCVLWFRAWYRPPTFSKQNPVSYLTFSLPSHTLSTITKCLCIHNIHRYTIYVRTYVRMCVRMCVCTCVCVYVFKSFPSSLSLISLPYFNILPTEPPAFSFIFLKYLLTATRMV